MSKNVDIIKEKIKNFKIEYLIIIVGLIAVVFLFLSSNSGEKTQISTNSSSVNEYVSMLENKLSKELSKIDGAGKVSVIISVKNGLSTVIATQKIEKENGGDAVIQENPVLVSGKPIILNEVYPEICGVVIVAMGANNLKVKASLLSATRIFLDVAVDNIEILTMER